MQQTYSKLYITQSEWCPKYTRAWTESKKEGLLHKGMFVVKVIVDHDSSFVVLVLGRFKCSWFLLSV